MLAKGIKSKEFNNACSTLNKINDYCVYNHIDIINIREKISELLALESADINFKHGYISVVKHENTKTYEIEHRCKDDSDRLVWLSDDSEMILRKAVALRKSENSDCPYLFLNHNSDDDKLHLRAVDNRLRKIQHELGFTDYAPERSPHDCRRTYASIQYLHGVDIKTIQGQLGHSSPQQTWDYIKDVTDACTRTEKLKKGNILNN